VVTSGTATLETALFNVPEVVIYKTSPITYAIGRPFVRIPFFSLVNLIMGKEVVKELLQFNLAKRIRDELHKTLFNEPYRQVMLKNYAALKNKMGTPGTSQRVASSITNSLR
jgi:lipid-A-disaccharide synthase